MSWIEIINTKDNTGEVMGDNNQYRRDHDMTYRKENGRYVDEAELQQIDEYGA